ncbi:hypothetical protein AAFN86_28495 [Roseomonas sp. CAU 1739]|uniref:hypothetical protein n=1 Tax=Roseomonas sp. CAU 1739 TaxID=3140364 RepID=UPI00325A7587
MRLVYPAADLLAELGTVSNSATVGADVVAHLIVAVGDALAMRGVMPPGVAADLPAIGIDVVVAVGIRRRSRQCRLTA